MPGDGAPQARKMAENQALFREVNERIKDVAEDSANVRFLCECASLECTTMLDLSMAEYERIRNSPVRFPVALGHDYPEVESVVEETDRYAVVQKHGEAAEVVAERDPRSTAI